MLYSFSKQDNIRCLADIGEANNGAAAVIGGPIALLIANSSNYADLVSPKFIDATEVYAVSTTDNGTKIKVVLAYQADRSAYIAVYNVNTRLDSAALVYATYIAEISILLNLRDIFKSTRSYVGTRKDVAPYVKAGQVILVNSDGYRNTDSITTTLATIIRENLLISACSKKYIVVNNIVLGCIGTGRAHKDLQVESKSFIGTKIPELSELLTKTPTGLLDLKTFVAALKNNRQASDYYNNHLGMLRPTHIAMTTALSDLQNTADIIVALIKTPESDAICTHLSAAWFKRAVKQKLTRYPIEVSSDGKYDVQRLSTEATIKYPGQSWKGARQDDYIYVVTHHGRPDKIVGCIGVDASDIKSIILRRDKFKSHLEKNTQYCNIDIDITTKQDIELKRFMYACDQYELIPTFCDNLYRVFEYYRTECLHCSKEVLKEQYGIDVDKYKNSISHTASELEHIKVSVEEMLTYITLLINNKHVCDLFGSCCNFYFSMLNPTDTVLYKGEKSSLSSLNYAAKEILQGQTEPASFIIDGDYVRLNITLTPEKIKPHSFNLPAINLVINGYVLKGIISGEQIILNDKNYHYYAMHIDNIIYDKGHPSLPSVLRQNIRKPIYSFSDYIFPMDYLYDSMRTREYNKLGTISVRQAIYGKSFESFTSNSDEYEDAIVFTGLPYLCRIKQMLPVFNYFGKYFSTYEEYLNIVAQEAEYDKCLSGSTTVVTLQSAKTMPSDEEFDDMDLDDMDIELDEQDTPYADEVDMDVDMDDTDGLDEDISIDIEDLEEGSDDAAWSFNRQSWIATHPNDAYIEGENGKIYWFDVLHTQMKADHEATGEQLPFNDIQVLYSVWQNILKGMPNVSELELLRMMYDTDDGDGDGGDGDGTTPNDELETPTDTGITTDDDDDLFADL